jgi:hypothetical protein
VRQRLRDVVIVVPGIIGSTLSRDGAEVWAPRHALAARSVLRPDAAVAALALGGTGTRAGTVSGIATGTSGDGDRGDPGDPGGDGIVAGALMPDARLVPGLVKVDGYTRLTEALAGHFEVHRAVDTGTWRTAGPARTAGPGKPGGRAGTAGPGRPGGHTGPARAGAHPAANLAANLVEFPYDWRQDNRITARRLAVVAERSLAAWRSSAHAPDARLIIVAHSMGGLVARYFLEVLGGWHDTRALITIGTPFRGSLDALGYLANGYKKLNLDLTEVMRTFPSVYQLLPVYPVVSTPGGLRRIAEAGPVAGVDPVLAADALAFHREIETAVAANDRTDPGRYALLPVVGTHQPTAQSAALSGTGLTLDRELPAGVDRFFGDGRSDGDGTVAICSATPVDQSEVFADVFQAEKHAGLQRNPQVLQTLLGRITKMQARALPRLRGPDPRTDTGQRAIGLHLDDLYAPGEPVTVRAEVLAPSVPEAVRATVEHTATGVTRAADLTYRDGAWHVTLPRQEPGIHRITVAARGDGFFPPPVHDVFEVGA